MTAERTNLPFAIQSEETSPAQTGHSEPVGCCTAAFRKAVVCVSCSISASGMTAVRTNLPFDFLMPSGTHDPNLTFNPNLPCCAAARHSGHS